MMTVRVSFVKRFLNSLVSTVADMPKTRPNNKRFVKIASQLNALSTDGSSEALSVTVSFAEVWFRDDDDNVLVCVSSTIWKRLMFEGYIFSLLVGWTIG